MQTWWRRLADSRPADLVIGDDYLRRWYVIPRNRIFNIYLHNFRHSDDDRALHDHPWFNFSYLLEGGYLEWSIAAGGVHKGEYRRAGDWKFRGPRSAHRIELRDHSECWTLFITGPRMREWGFHCPRGWRRWQDFTTGPRGEKIGRGCE